VANTIATIEFTARVGRDASYINYARLKFHPHWKTVARNPAIRTDRRSLGAQELGRNALKATFLPRRKTTTESSNFFRLQRSALDVCFGLKLTYPSFSTTSSLGFRGNH